MNLETLGTPFSPFGLKRETHLSDFLGGVGGDEDVLAALAVLAGTHVQLQRHPLHALDMHVPRLEVLEPLRKLLRLRILEGICIL